MTIVPLAHASIAYELLGRGDPTVLVHGSLSDRRTWERVRVGLAPALRVLVYDRRGYGESTGAVRAHPVRDDAADLAELLEALDLFPVHLIAPSYGGAVALRLAADRPEMVRSLDLHEPPFIGLLEDDPATAPEADRLWTAAKAMRSLARSGQPEAALRQVGDALSGEEGAWDRLARRATSPPTARGPVGRGTGRPRCDPARPCRAGRASHPGPPDDRGAKPPVPPPCYQPLGRPSAERHPPDAAGSWPCPPP